MASNSSKQCKGMHCVIGSGPAGVACAKALLARGAKVLMLDAGLELEPERARIVRQFAESKPTDWPAGSVAALKGDMQPDTDGVPLKMLFGSDFPYRETESHVPWQGHRISLRPSLALGGLSNVWGAAMLPYRDADITEWPIKIADLERHYRAVAQFTGLSAGHDDLEEWFPIYCENPSTLQPSEQAARLLRNLGRHRQALREQGWRFGSARLAVRAADSPEGIGCIYCGFCLYGCPYGCIYNSAATVRTLRADPNFSYENDAIVTSLQERAGKVAIEGFNRRTHTPFLLEAGRAFLAAGVIPTAQIVLRSLSAYDRRLCLRDSQYFFLPILLARRARGVRGKPLHTLSQVFLDLLRPEISPHTVHLQIYTYNDLIGQAIRKTLGPLGFLANSLDERMLVVQGYLHSDESQTISMTLKRDGEKDCLHLQAQPNPRTLRTVKRVLRELFRQARRLGGVPLPPLLQFAQPGRGYHCAGSIPMRREPDPLESDVLGRPHGWTRIHLADASVLPSVPATTITFSVMANAHRIGWESAALD